MAPYGALNMDEPFARVTGTPFGGATPRPSATSGESLRSCEASAKRSSLLRDEMLQ